MRSLLITVIVVCVAASVYGLEKKAVQMREDYGSEPLYNCYMNYYYFIPCPTNSWFWILSGWTPGEVVGAWFRVGDPSMGRTGSGCPPYSACDPCANMSLEQFRVLDFAGYGTIYPGLYTVRFDVWCADVNGCPVGPPLWSSGPKEFCTAGWNYVNVYPYVSLSDCYTQLQSNLKCYPRFLIAATHTGTLATYPAWGVDNVSSPLGLSCAMHDTGCCPAMFPRPQVGHYPTMHSGDYGVNFSHCPPQWFLDGADSVGNVYGFAELGWKAYLGGYVDPTTTEPTTWGNIKSIYK
jgi:hypothetical protein